MNRATPQLRILARRLIAYESGGRKAAGSGTAPAFLVFDKLRPQLATLMGIGGFRALLARALSLAVTETPGVQSLAVQADGSLTEGKLPEPHVTPEQLTEGKVILLAQLLGLLVTFIGENLTVRLVREVWPKISLAGLDLTDGEK